MLKYCESNGIFDSFSQIHSLAYSIVALQEAYLYTTYNPLYWITSVLTNNSGSTLDVDYEEFEEDSKEDREDKEQEVELKKQQTLYDKMARALGDVRSHGYVVSPPYVNEAEYDFFPNTKENYIVFSLKAIVGLSDATAFKIVQERKIAKFTSLQDFIQRVTPSNKELYALVKAGALDEFEEDRIKLMKQVVTEIVGLKETLNGQNIPFIANNNLYPSELQRDIDLKLWQKQFGKKNLVAGTKNMFYVQDCELTQEILLELEEDKDYMYLDKGIAVNKTKAEKVVLSKTSKLQEWLKSSDALHQFNRYRLNEEWKENCIGDISHWSFEALCYYPEEHELDKVDLSQYYISDFNELSPIPIQVAETKRGKITYPIYKLDRICGTVVAKNNTKHIVTLFTTTGIVDVKFNKGQYSYYNKQLSEIQKDGTKKVIEKSWFKRGNLLMIVGYRRENMFYPKVYSNSIYQHSVQKINKITKDNKLILQNDRVEE